MTHPLTLPRCSLHFPRDFYILITHCAAFITLCSQCPASCPEFNFIALLWDISKTRSCSRNWLESEGAQTVATADSYAECLAAAVARRDARSLVPLANLVTLSMGEWMSVPPAFSNRSICSAQTHPLWTYKIHSIPLTDQPSIWMVSRHRRQERIWSRRKYMRKPHCHQSLTGSITDF